MITLQHGFPGQHVMPETDGHGDLQVGKARHNRVGLACGDIDQRGLQPVKRTAQAVNFIPQIESQIGGNLVIAGTASMEFFSGFTDALDEPCLDVHVDIFERYGPGKITLLDVGEDGFQPGNDVSAVSRTDNANVRQHAGMCNGAGDIMPVEPLVEVDRCSKGLDEGVRRFCEAPAPGLLWRIIVCHVGNRNACFAAV